MPFCLECGKEIREDAHFSSNCGARQQDLSKKDVAIEHEPVKTTIPSHKAKTPSSKVAKIAAIVIIAAVVLIVVYALAPTLIGTVEQIGPSVIITSKSVRRGFIGLDYAMWIDVSVYNNGGSGKVVVWGEVRQGISIWKKSETVYLDSHDSRDLTLEFRGIAHSQVPRMPTRRILWRVWVSRP